MAGRREKAAKGKWNGGFAPYGYELINGELFIKQDEAEAVRIIFDKYIHTNLGVNGVTRYLQQHDIKKIARRERIEYFFNWICKGSIRQSCILWQDCVWEAYYTKSDWYKK